MSDLESRLLADAKRPVPVPDLERLLDAALPGRRRPHSPLVAAAVAVVLIGAGISALALHRASSADRDGNRPAISEVPLRVPYDGTIVGAITAGDSSRPTQLMLVASKPSGSSTTCNDYSATLSESATEVTVVSSVRRYPRSLGQSLQPAIRITDTATSTITLSPCDGTSSSDPNNELVLALTQPLGNRALIDTRTGARIPVFQSYAPAPQHLPAGYRPYSDPDFAPMAAYYGDQRPGSLTPISVGRFFHTGADDGVDGVRLEVVAAPTSTVVPGATVIDRQSVDGHSATVTQTAHTRCVTWAPDGQGLQVCSDTADLPDATPADLLTESELLTVARSLER